MTDHNRSVREDDTEGMDDLELITWSVPPHLEREPRPIGELERDWDEFARRVGIGRYRRTPASRRGPWLRWLAVLVLGVAGVAAITLLAQHRAPVVSAPVVRPVQCPGP